jgi:hypothetical protein
MKLIIEGQELIRAIRRGLDFDIPVHASVNIISGRGANSDRAEIDWDLEPGEFAGTDDDEDPPFTPDPEPEADVSEEQIALPIEEFESSVVPESEESDDLKDKKQKQVKEVADKDLFK